MRYLGFGAFFLMLTLSVGGCRERAKVDRSEESVRGLNVSNYSLAERIFIPDSLKKDEEKFIIEAVRAASQQMTGGDYEDPEDVIEQAQRTFEHIHGISVLGLYSDHGQFFIHPKDFTHEQILIFAYLKKHGM